MHRENIKENYPEIRVPFCDFDMIIIQHFSRVHSNERIKIKEFHSKWYVMSVFNALIGLLGVMMTPAFFLYC
jgi:hypothetical protein